MQYITRVSLCIVSHEALYHKDPCDTVAAPFNISPNTYETPSFCATGQAENIMIRLVSGRYSEAAPDAAPDARHLRLRSLRPAEAADAWLVLFR